MFIKIKKLHEDAVIPTYGSDGAGAFDIYATSEGILRPGWNAIIHTGLSFEIPPGFALMIYSRSGQGFKDDVKLSNSTGILDSDYRGELLIKLERFRRERYSVPDPDYIPQEDIVSVKVGDRIAQGIILPVPRIQFLLSEELSETIRGTGGFGSTGA